MRTRIHRPSRSGQAVAFLVAAIIVAHAGTAHATTYSWVTALTGPADNPLNWSPIGIPGAGDWLQYNVNGTYRVTFPSTIPAVDEHEVRRGNVTLRFNAPSTCSNLKVDNITTAASLTIDQGSLVADNVQVGEIGVARNSLTLTGPGVSLTGSGEIAVEDTSTINVLAGAQMTVGAANFMLATSPESDATWNISGRDVMTSTNSHVQIPANSAAPLVVGRVGTARISLTTGGSMDADCDVQLAVSTSSAGNVDIGPRGALALASTYLRARRSLLLGGNATAGSQGGSAVVSVLSGAFLETVGLMEVGDPDGSPAGKFGLLRLYDGSRVTSTGGVKFWPTPAMLDQPLALYGGTMHVRAGAFTWPASKILYVSSQVGTPRLWIANGVTNTGPNTSSGLAQVFVARSGAGELRVTQPGTRFIVGAGATTVADSATGDGSIVVDSSGTWQGSGPLNVGVRGTGSLAVTRGGTCLIGTLSLGTVAGATGTVSVTGDNSVLQAEDNVWVGGGFGGAGGSGSVVVDSSGSIGIFTTGGADPPLMTVYAGGSVSVGYGADIQSTGSISNSGQFELRGGSLLVGSLTQQPAGHLKGWGNIEEVGGPTILTNAGEIAPFASADAFGEMLVGGALNLAALSHYRVDLGRTGIRRADTLRVLGAATLGGTLDLVPDSAFVAAAGDTFTILTCGSRSGTFSAITWNGAPLSGQAQVVYEPNRVRVATFGTAGVEGGGGVPDVFRLVSVGGLTRLAFTLDLPRDADVDVRLHDVAGREVAILGHGFWAAGRHSFAANARGSEPSGVYFARATIRSGGTTIVRTAKAALLH